MPRPVLRIAVEPGSVAPETPLVWTLDAGAITFGVEARVAYRWLWVLEDRTQLCLTATVGFPTERPGRAGAEPAP